MSRDEPTIEIPLAEMRARQRLSLRMLHAERVMQVVGVIIILLHRSSHQLETMTNTPAGVASILLMLFFAVGWGLRFHWAANKREFLDENRASLAVLFLWAFSVIVATAIGGFEGLIFPAIVAVTELAVMFRAAVGLVFLIRWISSGGRNPAFILVASFMVLVAVGTVLLMLPRATASGEGAPFLVALFTATSASCVTGLIIVDTGSYWSTTGQVVIMCLFQIGGLGIMTCGSMFAFFSARPLQVKETAFLADMLESENAKSLKKLMISILIFTGATELIGAMSLWGLWPEAPLHERIFRCVFHSISAFCNAGFSLMPYSFSSIRTRWEVLIVFPALIIVGGLGFAVLADLRRFFAHRVVHHRSRYSVHTPHSRMRLTNTSWLVIATTAGLLLWGTFGFYLLESNAMMRQLSPGEQISASWFQSVTFRTAGFNSVDLSQLQPGTKFFAVMMMFVGASPGSTGGGIKTVAFALCILAVAALLRGRAEVELRGRTIPESTIKRGLMIVAMGIFCVLTTTLLIVVIESRPELFLDHLFEATSAFATVGVSSINTATLQPGSQVVIIFTMFVGRVGPLTMLVGLAARQMGGRYTYPDERVVLG